MGLGLRWDTRVGEMLNLICTHYFQLINKPSLNIFALSALTSDMSFGSDKNKKNNNQFDKYCNRLGYPNNMAKDARRQLGNQVCLMFF